MFHYEHSKLFSMWPTPNSMSVRGRGCSGDGTDLTRGYVPGTWPCLPVPLRSAQTLHSLLSNTSHCWTNGHPQHLSYSNDSTKCLKPQRPLNNMSNPAQAHVQGFSIWSRGRYSPGPQHEVAAGDEASGWIFVLYMTQKFKFCSNCSDPDINTVYQKGLCVDPWHENMSFEPSLCSFTK